jgi:hypothetical protein
MAREAQIVVRRQEHHALAVDAHFGIGCRLDGQQTPVQAGPCNAVELLPELGFELGVLGHRRQCSAIGALSTRLDGPG